MGSSIGGAIGSKAGGSGVAGPSQEDYEAIAFQNQQGKLAANQFGAQTGTGNYTGTTQLQNANDLQSAIGMGQLAVEQEAAQQGAKSGASNAAGTLAGLGGSGFGSSGGTFGSTGGGF